VSWLDLFRTPLVAGPFVFAGAGGHRGERRCLLHPMRIVTIVIAAGGIGLGCLSLLCGCGDESKTTGTQLQLTPQDKAMIEDMRSVMKTERAAQKRERVEDRKRAR
jgi:hypothetical protein